ncbi:MAG TPA: hypothetical protein EYP07_07865 [Kiloniellaceae bacterium]|nr:hypothetical protein [Kiloniellaceae bacterium]
MPFRRLANNQGGGSQPTGVAASVRRKTGTGGPDYKVHISLYPDALEKLGASLGDRVFVDIGDGEDRGLIRVAKTESKLGSFKIARYDASKTREIGYLRLKPFNGIAGRSERIQSCEFKTVGPGEIEIKLPGWAWRPSPKAAPRDR